MIGYKSGSFPAPTKKARRLQDMRFTILDKTNFQLSQGCFHQESLNFSFYNGDTFYVAYQ